MESKFDWEPFEYDDMDDCNISYCAKDKTDKDEDACAAKYKKFIAALVAIFAVECLALMLTTCVMDSRSVHRNDNSSQKQKSEIVYDSLAENSDPIHYLQTDKKWKNMPYSEGTIGTYGCGLTAAASYISWITKDASYTPVSLHKAVGDSCLTDGVNDMGKFCEYIHQTYEDEYKPQTWNIEEAKQDLRDGYCLFASVYTGLREEGKQYEGHIVLVYKWDDRGIWIMDPYDKDYKGAMSEEKFNDVFSDGRSYFYAIKHF